MTASRPVFDASAVLALMQRETGWEKLQRVQPGTMVNAVNLSEVLAKLVSHGMPAAAAQAAFDALHMEVTPFEPLMALKSAQFVQKQISLGDRCFLAACLHGTGWTSDRNLAAVVVGKGAPHLKFFR